MKNLLIQWEIEEENLRINLMKNLLTQWQTEEENQTTGGNVPLIDKKQNGNVLLINREQSGDVLLIDRKLAELENDTECASLPKSTELENDAEYASIPKLTELVKKPSNLTKTRKEKLYYPISHSLACFVEPVRRLCYCFVEGLMGWNDNLAMSGAELRGREVAVGFSG